MENIYEKLYKIKLDLLYYGAKLTDNCYNLLEKGLDGNVNHNDYITTRGLFLILDKQAYVNTCINRNSLYKIDFTDNEYWLLKKENKLCRIDIIQPPEFALQKKVLNNERGGYCTDF